MAIEIIVEAKLEKENEKESFTSFLLHFCKHMYLKAEDYGNHVLIEVCPKGDIEVAYEGCFISISAKTELAGPGFHAFVCKFIDELKEACELSFEVHDHTKYYEERNFENLKYGYFYKWLQEMSQYVIQQKEDVESLCWVHPEYKPLYKEGHIITNMGYIELSDFQNKDIEELAFQFFIWNTIEKDARYYRNCAISLLWESCFFQYSDMNEATEKVAKTILDYLEVAYDLDHEIALPLDAYQVLCNIFHREQIIPDSHKNLSVNGYRSQPVYYYFGNWQLYVSGFAERSFDKTCETLHFMAPYEHADKAWEWMMKANVYTAGSVDKSLYDNIYQAKETFMFSSVNYQANAVIQSCDEFELLRVIYQNDVEVLVLDCYCSDTKHLEMLKDWVQHVVYNPVEIEDDAKKLHMN